MATSPSRVHGVLSKRMWQAQVTTLLNTKTYTEERIGLDKVFWYSPALEYCQHKTVLRDRSYYVINHVP